MVVQTDRAFVLRVTRVAWEAALSEVLPDFGSRFAEGDIAGLASSRSTLLCARNLKISRERPSGSSRAELAAWCVFMFVDHLEDLPVPQLLLRQLQPLFAQQLTLICIDMQSSSAGWIGWIMERGDIRPLDGFQVVGAGALQSYREHFTHLMYQETSDTERYSRLAPVLGSGYSKLRNSTVLLIGASRSGSLAGMELAALGVGRMILADADIVELHNLDGMFWATPEDLGRPKAAVNARRMGQFRPDMAIHPLTTSIRDPNVRLPALCDLIVSCVDDEIARRHAALLASRWLLPHLDVAAQVVDTSTGTNASRELRADVRFVLPGEGCMVCIGAESNLDLEIHERLAPLKSFSAGQLRSWNQQRLGSLVTLNAMAVSIGVQTWLQFLSGELGGSIWHRLYWAGPTNLRVESGQVHGGGDCCGSRRTIE